MRFAYVTEVDISIDNGPGINEREFIRALLDLEPDSVCIVPEPRHPDIHFDDRLHYVTVNRSSRLHSYLGFMRGAMDKLEAQHARSSLHGVGIRIGVLPMLPVMARRTLGVPVFLKTLAGYGLMGADAEWRFRILSPALRPLYRRAIQTAVAADTASTAYVEWLSYMFGVSPSRFTLIPNGANTDFFQPGDKTHARQKLGLDRFSRIVGYVGALHGWRDLNSLVDAFAAVGMRDAGLVLVGSGPRRALIEERIDALGIRDRVVLTGQVPYATVPTYMHAFDVAMDLTVIAMRVGKGEALGSYSQKIPQYLAAGVPVVTWSVPDTAFLDAEGIGKTAIYQDVANLTSVMEHMLRLPDSAAREMGRRARSYAEQTFAAKALAERRVDLWRRSIGSDEIL